MPRYDLNGKVALVTGGARGIGFGTATALIKRGASVAILDLDQGAADAAAAQLHDTRAFGIGADVTDRGALQRAVATVVDRYGRLDVVVANAGIANTGATVRAMSSEVGDRVLEVNLLGVHKTVEAALPEIIRNQGHVVVVASVYAFLNGMGAAPYAMAKAGVEQLGRALRVELAPHHASASVAYFGFIDTAMVHDILDADPLSAQMFDALPNALLKRLKPSVAGEGIVRGIERRKARIILPKRWTIYSVLRGIINPLLDAAMVRDQRTQAIIKEMDARADTEQRTTA